MFWFTSVTRHLKVLFRIQTNYGRRKNTPDSATLLLRICLSEATQNMELHSDIFVYSHFRVNKVSCFVMSATQFN